MNFPTLVVLYIKNKANMTTPTSIYHLLEVKYDLNIKNTMFFRRNRIGGNGIGKNQIQ